MSSGSPGNRAGRFSVKRVLGYAATAVAVASSVVSCQMKQAELQAKQATIKLKEEELEAMRRAQAEQARERRDKARKEYLSTLSSVDRLSQARILRFIVAVETDERLRQWAEKELEELGKTVEKETAEARKSVEALAEEAMVAHGVKAEEAQLELAARSLDLARLKLARSTIVDPGAVVGPDHASLRGATKAECFAFCAPPARKCEAECKGDRACLKSRCFPNEVACRQECLKGPAPT